MKERGNKKAAHWAYPCPHSLFTGGPSTLWLSLPSISVTSVWMVRQCFPPKWIPRNSAIKQTATKQIIVVRIPFPYTNSIITEDCIPDQNLPSNKKVCSRFLKTSQCVHHTLIRSLWPMSDWSIILQLWRPSCFTTIFLFKPSLAHCCPYDTTCLGQWGHAATPVPLGWVLWHTCQRVGVAEAVLFRRLHLFR